MLQRPMQVQNN